MHNYRSGTKFRVSNISRLGFLGGVGASVAALAACGQTEQIVSRPPLSATQVRDLAFYMRKTRCAMVDYNGVLYFADGTVKQKNKQPDECGISPDASRRAAYCNYATPSPQPPVTIGYTFGEVGQSTIQWGLTAPVCGFGPGVGPIYKSSQTVPDCSNPIPDAQEVAEKAAEYIMENKANFAPAIITAAENAINDWEGTGLGVAASVEAAMAFLAMLGVALSIMDLLIIFAAIGITIAIAIELWKCFHG